MLWSQLLKKDAKEKKLPEKDVEAISSANWYFLHPFHRNSLKNGNHGRMMERISGLYSGQEEGYRRTLDVWFRYYTFYCIDNNFENSPVLEIFPREKLIRLRVQTQKDFEYSEATASDYHGTWKFPLIFTFEELPEVIKSLASGPLHEDTSFHSFLSYFVKILSAVEPWLKMHNSNSLPILQLNLSSASLLELLPRAADLSHSTIEHFYQDLYYLISKSSYVKLNLIGLYHVTLSDRENVISFISSTFFSEYPLFSEITIWYQKKVSFYLAYWEEIFCRRKQYHNLSFFFYLFQIREFRDVFYSEFPSSKSRDEMETFYEEHKSIFVRFSKPQEEMETGYKAKTSLSSSKSNLNAEDWLLSVQVWLKFLSIFYSTVPRKIDIDSYEQFDSTNFYITLPVRISISLKSFIEKVVDFQSSSFSKEIAEENNYCEEESETESNEEDEDNDDDDDDDDEEVENENAEGKDVGGKSNEDNNLDRFSAPDKNPDMMVDLIFIMNLIDDFSGRSLWREILNNIGRDILSNEFFTRYILPMTNQEVVNNNFLSKVSQFISRSPTESKIFLLLLSLEFPTDDTPLLSFYFQNQNLIMKSDCCQIKISLDYYPPAYKIGFRGFERNFAKYSFCFLDESEEENLGVFIPFKKSKKTFTFHEYFLIQAYRGCTIDFFWNEIFQNERCWKAWLEITNKQDFWNTWNYIRQELCSFFNTPKSEKYVLTESLMRFLWISLTDDVFLNDNNSPSPIQFGLVEIYLPGWGAHFMKFKYKVARCQAYIDPVELLPLYDSRYEWLNHSVSKYHTVIADPKEKECKDLSDYDERIIQLKKCIYVNFLEKFSIERYLLSLFVRGRLKSSLDNSELYRLHGSISMDDNLYFLSLWNTFNDSPFPLEFIAQFINCYRETHCSDILWELQQLLWMIIDHGYDITALIQPNTDKNKAKRSNPSFLPLTFSIVEHQERSKYDQEDNIFVQCSSPSYQKKLKFSIEEFKKYIDPFFEKIDKIGNYSSWKSFRKEFENQICNLFLREKLYQTFLKRMNYEKLLIKLKLELEKDINDININPDELIIPRKGELFSIFITVAPSYRKNTYPNRLELIKFLYKHMSFETFRNEIEFSIDFVEDIYLPILCKCFTPFPVLSLSNNHHDHEDEIQIETETILDPFYSTSQHVIVPGFANFHLLPRDVQVKMILFPLCEELYNHLSSIIHAHGRFLRNNSFFTILSLYSKLQRIFLKYDDRSHVTLLDNKISELNSYYYHANFDVFNMFYYHYHPFAMKNTRELEANAEESNKLISSSDDDDDDINNREQLRILRDNELDSCRKFEIELIRNFFERLLSFYSDFRRNVSRTNQPDQLFWKFFPWIKRLYLSLFTDFLLPNESSSSSPFTIFLLKMIDPLHEEEDQFSSSSSFYQESIFNLNNRNRQYIVVDYLVYFYFQQFQWKFLTTIHPDFEFLSNYDRNNGLLLDLLISFDPMKSIHQLFDMKSHYLISKKGEKEANEELERNKFLQEKVFELFNSLQSSSQNLLMMEIFVDIYFYFTFYYYYFPVVINSDYYQREEWDDDDDEEEEEEEEEEFPFGDKYLQGTDMNLIAPGCYARDINPLGSFMSYLFLTQCQRVYNKRFWVGYVAFWTVEMKRFFKDYLLTVWKCLSGEDYRLELLNILFFHAKHELKSNDLSHLLQRSRLKIRHLYHRLNDLPSSTYYTTIQVVDRLEIVRSRIIDRDYDPIRTLSIDDEDDEDYVDQG